MTNYLTRVIFPASIAGIMLLGCQALTNIDRSDIKDDLFKSPAGATGTAGDDSGGSGDPGGSDTGGSGGEGGGAGEAGAGGEGGEAGAGGGAGEAGAGGGVAGEGGGGAGGAAPLSFKNDIAPLFKGAQPTPCGGCHNDTNKAGGLTVISQANFIADQVNKPACVGFTGQAYVIPGDPDGSFLLKKLDPTFDLPLDNSCGAHMPLGGTAFTTEQVGTIRQWIQDGALE